MSDDLSGDMLAPSWPNLVIIIVLGSKIPPKFLEINIEFDSFHDLDIKTRKVGT